MKTFAYIAPITLTNHLGDVVKGEDGAPVVTTHKRWLLERSGDPAFADNIKGSEQIEFTMAVRRAIRDAEAKAEETGNWELEDAHADALWRTTAATRWNPALAHNMEPFVSSLRDRK